MLSSSLVADEKIARQQLRQILRQLQLQPEILDLHLQRIEKTLQLRGTEPLQGALADLFHAIPVSAELLQTEPLIQAIRQLPAHAGQSFLHLVQNGHKLPKFHALATRWSIFTTASAELPARARRASSDDAKRMAQELVHAMLDKNSDASVLEANFLAHCSACHDKLAFMLARREVLRAGVFTVLPDSWMAVADKLENLHEPGLRV